MPSSNGLGQALRRVSRARAGRARGGEKQTDGQETSLCKETRRGRLMSAPPPLAYGLLTERV
jgi:hypothetical protein